MSLVSFKTTTLLCSFRWVYDTKFETWIKLFIKFFLKIFLPVIGNTFSYKI